MNVGDLVCIGEIKDAIVLSVCDDYIEALLQNGGCKAFSMQRCEIRVTGRASSEQWSKALERAEELRMSIIKAWSENT